MKHALHAAFTAMATACVLLTACTGANKKQHLGDLYAITPNGPIDNDAYYIAPHRSGACHTINDNPTCGN